MYKPYKKTMFCVLSMVTLEFGLWFGLSDVEPLQFTAAFSPISLGLNTKVYLFKPDRKCLCIY